MTHPTSSSPFEKHPAFYEEDHRQFRVWNPVTREVLEKKHRALLPEWLVKGKRVLDLGSCLGATGQWCLHYGALSYTGVETQPEYAEASKNFLSHWEDRAVIVEAPIVDFLKKNVEKFDIVCMFGVLYAFVDYYRILSMASEASNEYVLIETLYPTWDIPRNLFWLPITQFIPDQRINLANSDASLLWFGSRLTPEALKTAMGTLGFFSHEGVLEVEKIEDSVDWYRPLPEFSDSDRYLQATFRYLMRFKKGENILADVGWTVSSDRFGTVESWNSTPVPPILPPADAGK